MSKNHLDLVSLVGVLRPQIRQKIDTYFVEGLNHKYTLKGDNSPVTEVDIFISELFKREILSKYPQVNFLSEEDQGKLEYPVCILDPLDGTKEFIARRDEFVVSFGIYYSSDIHDTRNFSWIYNPRTNMEVYSSAVKLEAPRSVSGKPLKGLVSRTEYGDNLHKCTEEIKINPIGSIAYKIALLSRGECDFVLTKRNKNIWDIIAGTHICNNLGINLFQNRKKIHNFNTVLFESDLLWCRDRDFEKISQYMKFHK